MGGAWALWAGGNPDCFVGVRRCSALRLRVRTVWSCNRSSIAVRSSTAGAVPAAFTPTAAPVMSCRRWATTCGTGTRQRSTQCCVRAARCRRRRLPPEVAVMGQGLVGDASYGLGQVGVVRGHEVAEHVGSNHHPLVVAPQVGVNAAVAAHHVPVPAGAALAAVQVGRSPNSSCWPERRRSNDGAIASAAG